MVYIVKTKNYMTTAYYYELIGKACTKAFNESPNFVENASEVLRVADKKHDVIITGHVTDAFKFIVKGFCNVGVWCQGIIPEERKMQNASILKIFLVAKIEKFVLRHANFLILVSEAQRIHFINKYGVHISETNSYIIPCFNEKGIDKGAFHKNSEPLIFTYTGGFGVWQCIDQTLEIIRRLQEIDPSIQFRLYTNALEKGKQKLEEYRIKNYVCKYLKTAELSDALKEVNYGFVLRDDTPVNNVATPTKFSTYLSNGVIPIYTACINSFATEMRKFSSKIELPDLNIDKCVEIINDKIKQNIDYTCVEKEYAEVFDDYYNTDMHIKKLADAFRHIWEKTSK